MVVEVMMMRIITMTRVVMMIRKKDVEEGDGINSNFDVVY